METVAINNEQVRRMRIDSLIERHEANIALVLRTMDARREPPDSPVRARAYRTVANLQAQIAALNDEARQS